MLIFIIGYDEGCITPEAKDLIDRLLELDRTKRLGSKGVEEIKSHPFFKCNYFLNEFCLIFFFKP